MKTLICDNVIFWMLQYSVFHDQLCKNVKICRLDLVGHTNIVIKKKYLSVLILDRENTLSFFVEHSVKIYELLMMR